MTELSQNARDVLLNFLLINPTSEDPIIHQRKTERPKSVLLKEVQSLVNEFEEREIQIDLSPYYEAISYLKSFKNAGDYRSFIVELVSLYPKE